MVGDYTSVHPGYTQGPQETTKHEVELSGNQATVAPGAEEVVGAKSPGEYICFRILNVESRQRSDRPTIEMGVRLTAKEAEKLGCWLLKAVGDSRQSLFYRPET